MGIGCQRGEGRMGFVITLAVILIAGFVGFKIIPVRIQAYQFTDSLREEARYASAHKDDAQVRERILRQAEELKIPLAPEDLSIKRTKREVIISAHYEQPIDLKFTTYTYRYSEEQSAPVF